jgi:hypothetical protein
LYATVKEINSKGIGYPHVKLVPLPSCAQFLNVIESVFSGMAKAVIHNSDFLPRKRHRMLSTSTSLKETKSFPRIRKGQARKSGETSAYLASFQSATIAKTRSTGDGAPGCPAPIAKVTQVSEQLLPRRLALPASAIHSAGRRGPQPGNVPETDGDIAEDFNLDCRGF